MKEMHGFINTLEVICPKEKEGYLIYIKKTRK